MRIPARSRDGIRFNITPLIDVVFLLIIFFLAASHLVRSEVHETVELPEASTSRPEEAERQRRLIVTIAVDGTYRVGSQTYDLLDVERLIATESGGESREFELRIRTDRRVPYQQIEPLLVAAARAGVTRVKFAVLPIP